MSGIEKDETDVPEPDAPGLALPLGDRLGEAIEAAAATLATVQAAADRVLGGLSRFQTAGSSALAVPVAKVALGPLGSSAVAEAVADRPTIAPTSSADAQGESESPARHAAVASQSEIMAPAQAFARSFPSAGTSGGGWRPVSAAPALLASFAPQAPVVPLRDTDLPKIAWPGSAAPPGDLFGCGVSPLERGSVTPGDSAAPQVPAPGSVEFGARTTSETSAASRGPASPMAQRRLGASTGGPTGGDVYLDGTRMGTWIADYLAREAGRPQSGGTGFDQRLTAPWPGTLQGG